MTDGAVDLDKVELDAAIALEKGQWDAEHELNKLFHTTIAEVAKSAIERSRDSAKYVQTAAAAISTLYAGLLALVFSATDNPLPLRGVFASGFLGLAVAFSTAYLAFLTKPKAPQIFEGGSSLAALQLSRSGYLTKFVNATVHNRRYLIRAGVVSLAFGVAFIPAAFVATDPPDEVPPAPTAPPIPGEVASPVASEAAQLFAAQVNQFQAASEARAKAIEDAPRQEAAYEQRENRLNTATTALAILCLIVTLALPKVLGKDPK